MSDRVRNYINGKWADSKSTEWQDVVNPATNEILASVPLNGGRDVDAAAKAAQAAFLEWRDTPPGDRIQYLFKLKQALEDNFEDLARVLTMENGKTLADARGELRRGIENVEVACGIPTMMQGQMLENIARGIDEIMIRQPVGVVAAITPFNFPGMIPLWFLPYAIACGNAMIVKPSERVPLTMERFFQVVDTIGLPPGVLSCVNGGKETVDAILEHPLIKGVSFVGSTPVARYVYATAAANGKRVQCQAGAKNHVVILPDADLEMTSRMVADAAFGCSGQRCLAVSVAVTVGDAHEKFREAMVESARALRVGYGLDEGVQMGPVITKQSQDRIEGAIARGISQGATALLDGRNASISGYEAGSFVNPTVLDGLPWSSDLTTTEIFGPVLSLNNVSELDQAIEIINSNPFGNASSIFTSSGIAARQFRNKVNTGNVGVNIGVAAPMAYFPFSGWKDSFLGVLHGQSWDAIDFYTDKKVVVERWPAEWSRSF
ncbi:MAG TPA: CoA-acylating methylmalonate-semialdehyde dehydrogenase [Dehalococcoidia bacterium]|nr:CoA-acylating methylmalonate-semialdehyde dehydrogenase [Dehalococcoidia bacterium]